MTHEEIGKLYRLQGQLIGIADRVQSQAEMNEKLRDSTDSIAAAQAYEFNHTLCSRLAFILYDLTERLEQVVKELEDV